MSSLFIESNNLYSLFKYVQYIIDIFKNKILKKYLNFLGLLFVFVVVLFLIRPIILSFQLLNDCLASDK